MNVFIDCGAPTLYNKFSRKRNIKGKMGAYFHERIHDSFEFTESEEYKTYLTNYIVFLKEHKNDGFVYPNLDVINNPEKTKENQILLESHGLSPIPVWHLGSDISYLLDYVKKYEYIAIGGMTPNPVSTLLPLLDDLWKNYLTDEKGMPLVKVHGFGMTSLFILKRYPWYSVDSTRWGKEAAYGRILCPFRQNGEWVFDKRIFLVPVSGRHSSQRKDNCHFYTLRPTIKQIVLDYISEKGYKIGKSSFKYESPNYKLKEGESWTGIEKNNKKEVEIIEEIGLCNSHNHRAEMNLLFFMDLEDSLPKWPWPFQLKKYKQKGLLE